VDPPGEREQAEVGRSIPKDDVRGQDEGLEEFPDRAGLRRVLDQDEAAFRDGHGELGPDLAGGGEQQGRDGSAGSDVADVRGDQAVQPGRSVPTGHGELSPGGEVHERPTTGQTVDDLGIGHVPRIEKSPSPEGP
jgi:hypothetical protein